MSGSGSVRYKDHCAGQRANVLLAFLLALNVSDRSCNHKKGSTTPIESISPNTLHVQGRC